MDSQFRCKNERRRQAVGQQKLINGIDYLEVAAADQMTLAVHFVHNVPGESDPVPPGAGSKLTAENFLIEGGVRVRNIRVLQANASGNVVKLTVSQRGDFSTYKLRLVSSPNHPETPEGFDPQLAVIDFSFKAACPSEFDCRTVVECPPPRLVEPEIDYLAKDYASFRRLMLDRMSILMPDWRERNPADALIALVEVLAYVGDHLSYFQDAVATEAYLGTARSRISLRRHARLLDYSVHDGCNARVWVCVSVEPRSEADGKVLAEATRLLAGSLGTGATVSPAERAAAVARGAIPFQTLHDLALNSAHNEIEFYTWSDQECCLPRGSTRATLRDRGLTLRAGDLLIFEEVLSPTTGLAADADPTHRHAVRLKRVVATEDRIEREKDQPNAPIKLVEIEWFEADALPFPLCLSARLVDSGGGPSIVRPSVARGNVVLADHGGEPADAGLSPDHVPDGGDYRPKLRHTEITCCQKYKPGLARARPAARALHQDPRSALPAVNLHGDHFDWQVQRDLLGSDRFAPEFVVEVERDGSAQVRFGDDVLGRRPSAGARFLADYRVGNGRAGNVGAESIVRVVTDLDGIERVRNPLPACGGTDPESMEQVRQFAPQAFRTQQRAVTEADYARLAERHPEVQRAAATFRWTGSWFTVFVTIDRRGGGPVQADEDFKSEIRDYLERFRVAGYDLEVRGPVFVPLDILLLVCVKPGYFRSDVKRALLQVFGRQLLPDGRRGFFHPDNFTFGDPVFTSRIYRAALDVPGVASVEIKKFQRFGKRPNRELGDAMLAPASLEIVRLDNDPNFPENGKIDFEMHGGL